jgi:3-phosphoglycerate kinase
MQKSMIEKDSLDDANKIIAAAKRHKVRLLLPSDVVVAKDIKRIRGLRTCKVDQLKTGEIALDLGPETIDAWNEIIAASKTVFWNGTLGRAEEPKFAKASESLAHAMISSGAKTIIGGGDTAAYIDSTNLEHHFSFVSTGGGASLELLAGKKLPGIEVLMKK